MAKKPQRKPKAGSGLVPPSRRITVGQRLVQIPDALRTRTRMEQALDSSGEELHRITDFLPLAIAYVDAEQRYCFTNTAYEEWVQRSRDDIIGRRAEEVLGKEVYEVIRERLEAALSGETVNFEATLQYKEKGLRDVSVIYSPYTGDRGEVEGFVAFITDVTAQKQAEALIRQSEERFRHLYRATPAMLHSIDREGRILSVSDYWLEVMGYGRSEVIGLQSVEFLTEDSRRYAEDVVLPDFWKRGFCRDVPYQCMRKDGAILDILLSSVAERDAEGNPQRALTVIADVTEQKKAQEALHHAREELESKVESRLKAGESYGLTFREMTVLHLVAEGQADKEIAAVLGIRPLTVSKHVSNILGKMGSHSRTEAGTRALREGLVD